MNTGSLGNVRLRWMSLKARFSSHSLLTDSNGAPRAFSQWFLELRNAIKMEVRQNSVQCPQKSKAPKIHCIALAMCEKEAEN